VLKRYTNRPQPQPKPAQGNVFALSGAFASPDTSKGGA
jgi:hypothetical protein